MMGFNLLENQSVFLSGSKFASEKMRPRRCCRAVYGNDARRAARMTRRKNIGHGQDSDAAPFRSARQAIV